MQFEKIRRIYWNSCRHEGYINILIYRPLAMLFTLFASAVRLHPNTVSLIAFAFSVAAAALFVSGKNDYWLLALLLFHIGKILDCSDGQLAAYDSKKSKFGAFLDPFLDRLVDVLTIGAICVGFPNNHPTVVVCVGFVVVSLLYANSYLDQFNHSISIGRKKNDASNTPSLIARLIKWDGGFTGLIVTLAVLVDSAWAVLAPYLGVFSVLLLIKFIKVRESLVSD